MQSRRQYFSSMGRGTGAESKIDRWETRLRRRGSLPCAVAGFSLLAGISSAHGQGAPGAGSFPGSMLVPGTQTSFKVGGYVKGDYVYDFSAQVNIIGGLNPGNIPLDANVPGTTEAPGHRIHGTSQMTASESRFNIETRTPTAYGELKTFIEADFTNPSGLTNSASLKLNTNSTGLRLRHAYGTLGPLLVGQFNSLFRDVAAEFETLDFTGPPGTAGPQRQPQFRYSYNTGLGFVAAVAAESPEIQFFEATSGGGTLNTTFGKGQGTKLPDLTGALTANFPRGHVSFRAVLRDIYDHDGSTVHAAAFGWGLGLSGHLNTWGKDAVIAQIQGGDGIGRYVNIYSNIPETAVDSPSNSLALVSAWGGALGYQHWWTATLRTTVAATYVTADYASVVVPSVRAALPDRIWSTHVNLIWSPVPVIDAGVEYIHETRRVGNGQEGDANRLQVSSKFKF
jgi:hypothetical protein